ncbi:MAG: hypothetical protein AAGD28_12065 [Bacteroidota bacterium]
MRVFSLSLILLLSAFHLSAQNTDQNLPIRFLFEGALEFGGEPVAEVLFTNGDTQSVHAGQGGSIRVGGEFTVPKLEQLRFRASAGIKYVTTAADNVNIRLTRIPIHLTANWMITKDIRLGVGFVSHQNINFKADGIGDDLTFDAANGPIFEIAWKGVGLNFTLMEYMDNMGESYSANAIGLTFSGVLPKR